MDLRTKHNNRRYSNKSNKGEKKKYRRTTQNAKVT